MLAEKFTPALYIFKLSPPTAASRMRIKIVTYGVVHSKYKWGVS